MWRPALVHPVPALQACEDARCLTREDGPSGCSEPVPQGTLAKHMQMGSHLPTIANVLGASGAPSATWKGTLAVALGQGLTLRAIRLTGQPRLHPGAAGWEGLSLPSRQLLPGPGPGPAGPEPPLRASASVDGTCLGLVQ